MRRKERSLRRGLSKWSRQDRSLDGVGLMTKMGVPPPTPDEWQRLPWLIKAWIVITIFAYSWQSSLAYSWLKMQGIDAQLVENNG
jgi:hypothetical protein